MRLYFTRRMVPHQKLGEFYEFDVRAEVSSEELKWARGPLMEIGGIMEIRGITNYTHRIPPGPLYLGDLIRGKTLSWPSVEEAMAMELAIVDACRKHLLVCAARRDYEGEGVHEITEQPATGTGVPAGS